MHNLSYTQTNDISCLKGFYCGVYEMDYYIQRNLQNHLYTQKNLINYIITEDDVIVALCTLKDHKLNLGSGNYIDTIEIEYLAVRRETQNKGIGRDIITWIKNKIIRERPNIKIITVDAFISDVTAYSAVPFYTKCGFITLQKKHPMSEVVKMALLIK